MNEAFDQNQEISELELQRCVDGELEPSQRRQLLRRLDQTGTGWRELALMFIEDRELNSGCREFLSEPPAPQPRIQQQKSPGWLSISWPLVAASIAIGLVSPLVWKVVLEPGSTSVAQVPPVENEGDLHRSPGGQESALANVLPPVGHEQESAPLSESDQTPIPVTELNLVREGDPAVSIPVYSHENFPHVWPRGGSLLPRGVDEAFQQRGLRLERNPSLFYYRLDDGSQIVVPVESIQVKPVMQ